jgi:DNA mismatch endonuclease (patch repair protein)
MSRIRGKDTKPELLVFRYLRKNKVYFQKHYRSREGIVMDVALPRKKMVVFIDGDFWHGRSVQKVLERRGESDFWTKKLIRNIERDREQSARLTSRGWKILRVWESDLKRKSTRQESLSSIKSFLESNLGENA